MDVGTLSLGGALSPVTKVKRLFSSGEQGLFYDLKDLGSLYQDSGATTPVTAVGQPVGKIVDKSGRGNDATQPTSTARPTLQQDSSGRYYLLFDGIDDFLLTGAIDFSASDKMTVFYGVRKNSDAAAGTICELSASYAANAGSFYHNASADYVGTPGGYYRAGARGNAAAAATQNFVTTNSYAAPITNVITATHNIAGDSTVLRINGVQVGTATGDKGLGNFGNYPIYIGMRAGTSIPFNGRLYSIVVRGAASSTAEIDAAEKYMNSCTGAY